MKTLVCINGKWYEGTLLSKGAVVSGVQQEDEIDGMIYLDEDLVYTPSYDQVKISSGQVDVKGKLICDGDILVHSITKQMIQVSVKAITQNSLDIIFQDFSQYEILQKV